MLRTYKTVLFYISCLFGVSIILLDPLHAMEKGQLSITIDLGSFTIAHDEQGDQIVMADTSSFYVPGKPYLPAKKIMVSLPPGTRAISCECNATEINKLKNTYSIKPSPPIIPLMSSVDRKDIIRNLSEEWQKNNKSVYRSDQPYPDIRCRLTGAGTLRKYSYAEVTYYPFSYVPRTGVLYHYPRAEIIINYVELNSKEEYIQTLLEDNVADTRAEELFANFKEMEQLYRPRKHSGIDRQPHDLVIITVPKLVNSIVISDYITWKESLGYQPYIILITDPIIQNQTGVDLEQKIRYFLMNYYIQWGIEYLLIVGSVESIPMRYCFYSPYYHAHNPSNPTNPGGSVPTDYYYADLSYDDNVSWDLDGDGYYGEYQQDMPDFLADIYVGRIPTSNTSEITYALNKIVAYEQDTGSWKQQALHPGAILFYENQDHEDIPEVDGATVMDVLETNIMSNWTTSHFSEQDGLKPSDYDWSAINETAFTTEWRNGQYGVVNWAGHGFCTGASRIVWDWDDGDGVPEDDDGEISHISFVTSWSDYEDDYPSIVFAISCNIGYPEQNAYGNLGIDLLCDPALGAGVGILSATRGAAAGGFWPKTPGGAQSMCYEFNRFMISGPRYPEPLGAALYDSKFFCHQNYGWDHHYQYLNNYDYNLYGDPTMLQRGIDPQQVPELNVTCIFLVMILISYPIFIQRRFTRCRIK